MIMLHTVKPMYLYNVAQVLQDCVFMPRFFGVFSPSITTGYIGMGVFTDVAFS